MGVNSYTPTNTAVASAFACEVCLVLDRSHSMCWDTSGTTYSYPPPIGSDRDLGLRSPPADGSRWKSLDTAINSFCGILRSANAPPRVAAVTWSSDVGTSTYEYQLTGHTTVGVTTDIGLTSDMNAVYSAVHSRTQVLMHGATDMASGINQGTAILTSNNVRPFARKVMIMMTDGQWNTGNNPIDAAAAAVGHNITIHCICFLANADQTTTQNIASMAGGKF